MTKETRRRLVQRVGAAGFGVLAGCITRGTDETSTESSPSPASSPSPTPTTSRDLSPDDLLPREDGGWTQDRVESGGFSWSARGAEDGIFGYYISPENQAYEVVIMEMGPGYDPELKANNWTCNVGWNVALSYERFAIAASTGTLQKTFTPEKPPTMTRTPIPETVEPTKDLLANSPVLSREYVDRHAITEADC